MNKTKHVTVSNGDLIDISDLHIKGNKVATIMYKMNVMTFIIGMLAIVILVSFVQTARIIGYIFAAVACFVYFSIKDQKVMEIYDDCIVLYDTEEINKVLLINLDNLSSYSCNKYEDGFNIVVLRTETGDAIYCETYESNKANKYLRKIAKDKDLHNQELNNYQSGNLFSNIKTKIKETKEKNK